MSPLQKIMLLSPLSITVITPLPKKQLYLATHPNHEFNSPFANLDYRYFHKIFFDPPFLLLFHVLFTFTVPTP